PAAASQQYVPVGAAWRGEGDADDEEDEDEPRESRPASPPRAKRQPPDPRDPRLANLIYYTIRRVDVEGGQEWRKFGRRTRLELAEIIAAEVGTERADYEVREWCPSRLDNPESHKCVGFFYLNIPEMLDDH